jgi:hypothetical protein
MINIEHKQRRVYTLRQAANELGVTYVSLWRAAARGDLKVLKGFPRLAVSTAELERFLSSNTEYCPKRRKARECRASVGALEENHNWKNIND